jgi:hypothetical protein
MLAVRGNDSANGVEALQLAVFIKNLRIIEARASWRRDRNLRIIEYPAHHGELIRIGEYRQLAASD